MVVQTSVPSSENGAMTSEPAILSPAEPAQSKDTPVQQPQPASHAKPRRSHSLTSSLKNLSLNLRRKGSNTSLTSFGSNYKWGRSSSQAANYNEKDGGDGGANGSERNGNGSRRGSGLFANASSTSLNSLFSMWSGKSKKDKASESSEKLKTKRSLRRRKTKKNKRRPTNNNNKTMAIEDQSLPSPNLFPPGLSFTVGVSEDSNLQFRATMEDYHTYITNFRSEADSGYFAIFDGHAGKHVAKWCGLKLHELISKHIRDLSNDKTISTALKSAFLEADMVSSQEIKSSSGSTAAVAVLKWEPINPEDKDRENQEGVMIPKHRMLYTANAGDTRIVLCRHGKAVRLTYDHKGSDSKEQARIIELGGVVISNRVNGILAVTRAFGDQYMKNLITAKPYTTETEINSSDEFLIIACDGLWDVCSDQEAVDYVRSTFDPKEASQSLVNYALKKYSTDNVTVMVIRLDNSVFCSNL